MVDIAARTLYATGVPLLVANVTFFGCYSAAGEDAERTRQQIRMAQKGKGLAIEAGLLEGICTIELIRPDLMSVTLDGGIVGSLGENHGPVAEALGGSAADLERPTAFFISSADDPTYEPGRQPVEAGRASYEWYNCLDAKHRWPLVINKVFRHDYYLRLPIRLTSGRQYTLHVQRKNPDPRFPHQRTFEYHEGRTRTKVIKINQVGYSAASKRRYAYLGWWAGSLGAVDYSGFKRFRIVDEDSGGMVHDGEIRLRAKSDPNSGEHIYEMDISALQPGRYHIQMPGFARSDTFEVGGQSVFEMYYHGLRAFFHQRCGQELRPPWTAFAKPACHTEVWESGNFVAGPGAIHHAPGGRLLHANYRPGPAEKKRAMKGGYHDAADFDSFAVHLTATSRILTAYEMHPKAFTDGDLNIPESGNGIPDILDEAEWGLRWYLEYQYPNGAVPLGRINLCDARQQNIKGGNEGAPMPPYGIIPPRHLSTPLFAAVAAQFARCLRPIDPARSSRYQEAAIRAFEYASSHSALEQWQEFSSDQIPLIPPDMHQGRRKAGFGEDVWQSHTAWAAAELLLNTGLRRFNRHVLLRRKAMRHWKNRTLRFWPYLQCDPEVAHGVVQNWMRNEFLSGRNHGADSLVRRTESAGYRMGNGQGTACGWGACQGANHGDLLLRAYHLTREQKYLDAACHNADWHLGANPLSKTLVTSMGHRYPNRPQISWYLYENQQANDLRGPTVRGIPIFGIGPPLKNYPGNHQDDRWPLWRSWRDVWGNWAEIYSEFTVHQTIGPAAMLYATLYALEQEADRLPADLAPAFPLGARTR